MIVAIDLSMRSAGIVVFAKTGRLVTCKVLRTKKEDYDNEHLLLHLEREVKDFLATFSSVSEVIIEGLSFNAKAARRDLIDGNWWNLVKEIREAYPDIPILSVPVTKWRATVLSKVEQRELKKQHKTDPLKKGCVAKLPTVAEEMFYAYLKAHRLPPSCMYDLADAYWIGSHRLHLHTAQESRSL